MRAEHCWHSVACVFCVFCPRCRLRDRSSKIATDMLVPNSTIKVHINMNFQKVSIDPPKKVCMTWGVSPINPSFATLASGSDSPAAHDPFSSLTFHTSPFAATQFVH